MKNEHSTFPKTAEDLVRLAGLLGVDLPVSDDIGLLRQSVEVDGYVLPNRLAIHPMEGCDGEFDGRPGELTLRRYRRFTGGGAGLIWAEAIAVTPEGRANPRQLYINRQNIESFRELVALMRKTASDTYGSEYRPMIVAQLTHSGRYSKPFGKSTPIMAHHDPYRDAVMNLPADYPVVTDEYLDALQGKFLAAAELAYEAGFDSVDIKCCHGYLLHELLSGHLRGGRYGGSFENRVRMLLETVEKIRVRFGAEKSVCTRLGIFDAIPLPHGWGVGANDYLTPDLNEPQKLISELKKFGVNLVNITLANPYYNPYYNRPFDRPTAGGAARPEHPLVGVARLINLAGEIQQSQPEMTIVSTGYSWLRQHMPTVAAGVIEQHKAKLIGAGRLAFAYPDFAKDIINTGRLDENRVCIACSSCTQIMRDGGMAGCPIRDSEVYGPILREGRQKAKNIGEKMNDKPVAVVTGAARGIGMAIAVQLAKQNYDIIVADMCTAEDAGEALAEISDAGGNGIFCHADISDAESRGSLLDFTRKKFGQCNLLVNNAGVAPLTRMDILETTVESFQRVLRINLEGTFFVTQLFANWMIEQKTASVAGEFRIVNIGSMSAYTSSTSRGEYCISKAGVGMVTTLFADRLAEYGIGVFEIRPGIIQTKMTAGVKDKYDKLIAEGITPTKRWGQPQDIAKAVGCIADGGLDFSTGQVINVDGGFHMRRL